MFGIPKDFRNRLVKFLEYFKVVVEDNEERILELVKLGSFIVSLVLNGGLAVISKGQ